MGFTGRKKAFLTGGGGYVGARLAQYLEEHGYEVAVADIKFADATPGPENGRNRLRLEVDICDKAALLEAVGRVKPDVVFHIASYGMSGKEQLNRKLIEAVNIHGTRHVLQACKDNGVECLVYTSTYNVVFGGQVIENGDESLPYLPQHKHVDHYSCTKCTAEQEVMKSNGTPVKGGGTLKVCALRLAGVYGEGEQRHLPRIVNMIERGMYLFTSGSPDSKVDFLHIDNLVQAHHLAGEALLSREAPAAGQVYNISDGRPINNFVFFQALVEGLGYSNPKIRLPLWILLYFAYLTELVHGIVGKYVYNFQPFLTQAEVYKVGVTHYFCLDKAKHELGYAPQKRSLEGVVTWFKERGHGRKMLDAVTEENSNSFSYTLRILPVIVATAVVLLALSVLFLTPCTYV